MRGSGECPERQRGRTVNPLADAFVGSSPTSPTTLEIKEKTQFLAGAIPAIFMSHMLHYFLKQFQWLPLAPGGSMQHECDMDAVLR